MPYASLSADNLYVAPPCITSCSECRVVVSSLKLAVRSRDVAAAGGQCTVLLVARGKVVFEAAFAVGAQPAPVIR